MEKEFPGAGRRIMLLNARQLEREPSEPSLILPAMEDISDKKL